MEMDDLRMRGNDLKEMNDIMEGNEVEQAVTELFHVESANEDNLSHQEEIEMLNNDDNYVDHRRNKNEQKFCSQEEDITNQTDSHLDD
jgi:hypothetical protein